MQSSTTDPIPAQPTSHWNLESESSPSSNRQFNNLLENDIAVKYSHEKSHVTRLFKHITSDIRHTHMYIYTHTNTGQSNWTIQDRKINHSQQRRSNPSQTRITKVTRRYKTAAAQSEINFARIPWPHKCLLPRRISVRRRLLLLVVVSSYVETRRICERGTSTIL